MPKLDTPTVKELRTIIEAQLTGSIGEPLPLFPRSFLRVLANTLAGVGILLYKYAGFLFLQIFVETATNDEVEILGKTVRPLTEWGRLIGVGDPVAATHARLRLTVTVNNQTGELLSGTQYINALNGFVYLQEVSQALDGATVEVDVEAASDQAGGGGAGVLGNLAVADPVDFVQPLANVDRTTVVESVLTTAADEEDIEVYRQRVIDRFRKRLQGGALVDYEAWALETAGIVNSYPYRGVLPGEVDVFSEATVLSSGDPDGIPTADQLIAVKASIDALTSGLAARRPANAAVNSFAITRAKFEIEVDTLDVPAGSEAEVQASITEAVTEYLLDREPLVPGLTLTPPKDTITKNDLIGLVVDIVRAAGGSFDTLLFNKVGSGVVDTYQLAQGEKAGLGGTGVTFI